MFIRATGIAAIALCIVSCARHDDVELLKGQVATLELANANIRAELKRSDQVQIEMEARLKAAEINIDTVFAQAGSQKQGGEWILWESQIDGPVGVGFTRPAPRLALSSRQECTETITYNMKKLGGNERTGQWSTGQGYVFRATCLPKGVDPR